MSEDERARLAAQLQDGTATRLAAIANRLDAIMARADADVQRVIGRAAAELGEIAAEVRTMIGELQRGDADPASVTGRIRALSLAAGQRIGATPTIRLDGPVDELDPGLAADLVAVADEALTNVVRHAYAGTLTVAVEVAGGRVALSVLDDGVGPNDEPTGGTGLVDLRSRAEARGGEFDVEPNRPLGTALRWSVPLP